MNIYMAHKTLNSISRKDFLKTTGLAAMGLTLTSGILSAKDSVQADSNVCTSKSNKLVMKNVRLETGFEYEGDEVSATKTELFTLTIENGKITKIEANQNSVDGFDAKGKLLLPAFKDMHIHLDKTYYGDKWKAVSKRQIGVKGMIELEEHIILELLKNS